MVCPQCSAMNDDAAHYCNDCGFQLQVRICPECSSANIDTARFCNHCGFEFEDEGYERESAEDEQLPGLAPKPSSKRTGCLVTGIVLLCILLGAGIPIFVGVHNWIATLAPTNVVQTYCNDLINKDALGAYQQFALDLQLQIPSDTFAAGVRAGVYAQDGGLKKCNVVKLVINHDTRAVAFLDLVKGNGKVEPTIIDLVLENGVWKIEHPGGLGTNEL